MIKAQDQKLKLILTAIIVLAAVYIAAVFVLPKMKIWAVPGVYKADASIETQLRSGMVFEYDFNMAYEKICGFGIDIDPMDSNNVIKLDANLELLDSDHCIIAAKHITSAYDSYITFPYIKVIKGDTYTVRLTVGDLDVDEQDIVPTILINDDGGFAFNLSGIKGSSDNKAVFTIMYMLTSMMILLFVSKYLDRRKINKEDTEEKIIDIVIIGTVYLSAMFMFSQYYDLFIISKSVFRMADAFKAGHVFDYFETSYLKELNLQSNLSLFICPYNIVTMLLLAIILFPFLPFFNGDVTEFEAGNLLVAYLTVVIGLLVLMSFLLFKYVAEECNMGADYLKDSRLIYIASSVLVFTTVTYGQIDILYVIVILLALPFYYRKKYVKFSFIMSFAVSMKMLPLMVFIPMILLANKRIRDIVINLFAVMLVPLTTSILFQNNTGYKAISNMVDEQYAYINGIVQIRIGDSISVFILAYVIICLISYFHKADIDNKKEMLFKSMLIIFTTYSLFSALVYWHLQWMIILALSFAFLVPFFKDANTILNFSILGEILFILLWRSFSAYMMNDGIIPSFTGQYYAGIDNYMLTEAISPLYFVCIKTAYVGLLAYLCFYMIKNRPQSDINTYKCSRASAVGRIGVMYAFVLFNCWCMSFIG